MDSEQIYSQPSRSFFEGLAFRERPANLQAEQAVIGTLIASGRHHEKIADILQPHHFADPVNRSIYAEQVRRIGLGYSADPTSMKSWLETDQTCLDHDAGHAYMLTLIDAIVHPENIVSCAHEIVRTWQRREVIDAAEDFLSAGFDNDADPAQVIPAIVTRLEDSLTRHRAKSIIQFNDALEGAMLEIENAQKGIAPRILKTGFRGIDGLINGFRPGSLNVLAGRPGMGKSSLGHQIALNAARSGVGVLEISLEMTAEELAMRSLALASGVPGPVLTKGDLTPNQVDRIMRGRHEMAHLPLMIEDGSSLTMGQIVAVAKKAQRQHTLGLIVVDHLHIVKADGIDLKQSATWAVGRISGAMKKLAKDFDCPVLLLAQLNRGVEGRDDKRPGLSDLRMSGDIEQDADTVSFVYRQEYYLGKSDPEMQEAESPEKHRKRVESYRERKAECAGRAELIFAKVRSGATGTVPLIFHGPTTSFSDAE
jgi:replicative DNA helicase